MSKNKMIIDKYAVPFCVRHIYIIAKPTISELNKIFYSKDPDGNKDELISKSEEDEMNSYLAYAISGAFLKSTDEPAEIIVYNRSCDEADMINTIAHESTHAAHDMLESSNIKLTKDTEEVYAYLTGYISECFWKTLKKTTNE
nr:MAG TPA: peptidase [Caudoviricetes sp.]